MRHLRIIFVLMVVGSLVTLAGIALAQQAGWIAPLVEEYSLVWKDAYDETAKHDLPPAGREAVADRVLDSHIATRSAPGTGPGPSPAPTPSPTPPPTPPTPSPAPSPTPDRGTGDCASRPITAYDTFVDQWVSGCDSAEPDRGYARYYSFTLESESFVTITLESRDADPYLYLRQGNARSGTALHENDDRNGSTRISQIQEDLPAGSYTIEATTYSPGVTGIFSITVSGLADVPTPTPTSTPTGKPLIVSDIDGYTSEFRIEIFVSTIGVNLAMTRRNVFTADGATVRLDSDGNMTTGGFGTPLSDRYNWACNPVNGSTGESRHYANDEYNFGLPETDLNNAPLLNHSLGRQVSRICSGDESAPSSTVRTTWTVRFSLR